MQYRRLGNSGLTVSVLCLGTLNFGAQTDEQASIDIIDRARDRGVNFIDVADSYNDGVSEEILGRAISGDRNDWIVATKVGKPMSSGYLDGGLSRRWVLRAAEASLRRLKTDTIDLYYLHREDQDTPLEETVHAIGDLIRSGKIRYFGVSNYQSWKIAQICRICDEVGMDRPIASQPPYNALNRIPEAEHLPACGYFGLGVAPYSPLARGILTGKYDPDDAPEAHTRAGRQELRLMQTEWRPESLLIARDLKAYADARGTTAAKIAIGWVLNHTLVASIVCGPRTAQQWAEYIGAIDYEFTIEDEALIDSYVVSGHASTLGYFDPAHPPRGRMRRI